jgi:hypothetical protein
MGDIAGVSAADGKWMASDDTSSIAAEREILEGP